MEQNKQKRQFFQRQIISFCYRLTGKTPLQIAIKCLKIIPVPLFFHRRLKKIYTYLVKKEPLASHLLENNNFCTFDRIADQEKKLPDYFLFSSIDWNFIFQRPQHFSALLSKTGRRVFFIRSSFLQAEEDSFVAQPLDKEGRLFQITLFLQSRSCSYDTTSSKDIESIRKALGRLFEATRAQKKIFFLIQPLWSRIIRGLPCERLVYDCLDFQEGFAGSSATTSASEAELLRKADLVVTTAQPLYDMAGPYNANTVIIRNACEYEYFSVKPDETFKDKQNRKIIGYFGIIADWFDLNLIEAVAGHYKDCLILLIGPDFIGARSALCHIPNILFTGTSPYDKLTYYLYSFDVCLLPFRIVPLTLAINPVKLYEYLSSGKPVVSVNLPEMTQFCDAEGPLVYVAEDKAGFVEKINQALSESTGDDEKIKQRRREFAAQQTWEARVQELILQIEK